MQLFSGLGSTKTNAMIWEYRLYETFNDNFCWALFWPFYLWIHGWKYWSVIETYSLLFCSFELFYLHYHRWVGSERDVFRLWNHVGSHVGLYWTNDPVWLFRLCRIFLNWIQFSGFGSKTIVHKIWTSRKTKWCWCTFIVHGYRWGPGRWI